MGEQLIECVPNFSDGRDMTVIKQITDAIESVEGVTLLDVDPGRATNRTVVTFVGEPEPVIEAAVRAGRKAKELIDMSRHHGEHPRFGAMDVCPLIPISGISMDEVVPLARRLGKRLGDEAGISGYFYEYAATKPGRRNLAACRAGEYEGLPARLNDPNWKTDFGPGTFDPKYGVTAVGARDFLIAYNVNLNTTSTRWANAIAYDIREKGRVRTHDGTPNGKPVLDDKGEMVWIPGSLKHVKAIGWFIEEYGIAQISINLTKIRETPMHIAFDETCRKAEARGVRVTGSELVGMVPLSAMLEAGRYFLHKQHRSSGVSDRELIKIAVKSLGLSDLRPFNPDEKIIEYAAASRGLQTARTSLVKLPLRDFVWETASESPAPGGGSVSAAMGAMGVSLAVMVASLSAHKRGWEDRWQEFSEWAEKGKTLHDELLRLIDEDARAFNGLMAAFGLPQANDADKAARKQAIQDATRAAIEAPLAVMKTAHASFELIRKMAEIGNPNSVSDAGVAALGARSAVMGAMMNVQINAKGVADKAWIADVLSTAAKIQEETIAAEREVLEIVTAKL